MYFNECNISLRTNINLVLDTVYRISVILNIFTLSGRPRVQTKFVFYFHFFVLVSLVCNIEQIESCLQLSEIKKETFHGLKMLKFLNLRRNLVESLESQVFQARG
jgi:hypothetical protein